MTRSIPGLIKQLIKLLGENPEREGLRETPKRIDKMYQELLKGYRLNPKSIFKRFDGEKYTGLIVVSDIDFYSLCEHHLLPFHGRIHIGYIPDGHILGLSKFARLVEIFARRAAGKTDKTNRRRVEGKPESQRRSRVLRGGTFLHEYAGRKKNQQQNQNFSYDRFV